MKLLWVIMFLVLSIGVCAYSDTIDIQGVLKNSTNGALINGSKLINFTLYNKATGEQIWSETQSVLVYNGIFNYIAGKNTTLASTDFETYELNYILSIDGEAMTKLNFSKSPYAFYADRCDYLDGQSGAYYLDNKNTNCSVDGSCSLITYDSELAYIGNCSGKNCDIGWGNLTSVPADILDGDDDTIYVDASVRTSIINNITNHQNTYKHGNTTAEIRGQFSSGDGNITYNSGTGIFKIIKLDLGQFTNSLGWITNAVSNLVNYYTITQTNTYLINNITAANTSMKSYVDAQDAAQDECSEITGCVVGAITDGNTNWDNSYNFITNITMNKTVNCADITGGDDIDFCSDTSGTGGGGTSLWVDGGNYLYPNSSYANNIIVYGYIKANNWSNVTIEESQITNLAHTVDTNCSGANCNIGWGNLTSVPADILDGDDDTIYAFSDFQELNITTTDKNITITEGTPKTITLSSGFWLYFSSLYQTISGAYTKTNLTIDYPNLDTDSTNDLSGSTVSNWISTNSTADRSYTDSRITSMSNITKMYVDNSISTNVTSANTSMKTYVDDNSINNIVEDTTPQLGGNLDANDKKIIMTNASYEWNIYINSTGWLKFERLV